MSILENKLEKYSKKIKDLFEELIKIKKSRVSDDDSKYFDKTTNSGLSNHNLNKYKNIKEPYTYRLK